MFLPPYNYAENYKRDTNFKKIRAMEEILNRLQELKTAKVAIYHSANKDRDKNYAHGAMLAYGAAMQIIKSAMAKSPNESSGLNIPVVSNCEHVGKPTASGSDKRKCSKCGEYYTGAR